MLKYSFVIFLLVFLNRSLFAEELNANTVVESAMEILPSHPGEHGDITIEGVDSDADGVRDDIEHFIESKLNDSLKMKRYAYWYAYVSSRRVEFRNTDMEMYWALQWFGAMTCIFERFSETEVDLLVWGVKGAMDNTKVRANEHRKFNGRMGGSSIGIEECQLDTNE